jgi:hypothetical protein
MWLATFQKAMSRVEVNPGFPPDLTRCLHAQAESLSQGQAHRADATVLSMSRSRGTGILSSPVA